MSTEDARPFASLKQSAENFKTGFDEDINYCMALLNEKITDLIRDPDSLGASSNFKKNVDAHLEFSKAKFDIFLSMKSHFDEIKEKWSTEITEMAKDFLENVEIFLAETKLEAKSLSSSVTAKKSRLSSSKQDVLQSVSATIYPIISSIATKVPIASSLRGKSSATSKESDESIDDGKALKPLQRNTPFQADVMDYDQRSDSDNSSKQEVELPKPALRKGGRPRKGTTNTFNESSDLNETYTKVSARTTRRAVKPASNGTRKATTGRKVQAKKDSDEEIELPSTRTEHVAEDITDEFDVHPTTTKSRRKTMFVPQTINEDLSDQEPSPEKILKAKSKRKTMAGFSDFTVAPSPKRLKTSGRKSMSLSNEEDETKSNPLDGGDSTELGNYTSWIDLKSVNANVPSSSAIYELKVWRAKKPAFIGSCENLRHTLTLHKLGQSSGHKHLDKFLERNMKDVSVRYEVASSIQEAKAEVKNRINNFVQIHKTTPAYN